MTTYTLKNDEYSVLRGGRSRFINLYCEHCGYFILLYQKDGPGKHLKRLYLDRIHAPKEVAILADVNNNKEVPNLVCKKCHRLIAIPDVYDEENRKVFLLFSFSFVEKASNGVFPSEIMQLNDDDMEEKIKRIKK